MNPGVLDSEIIAGLRDLEFESPGLLAELLEIYRNQSAPLLNNLRNAFRAGDSSTVAKLAHTLKGSSANLGATRVAKLAEALEREPQAADWETRLARVEAEIAEALTALAEVSTGSSATHAKAGN